MGVTGPSRTPRADPGSDCGSRIGSDAASESTDVSPGRGGARDRSRAEPGSRTVLTGSLVPFAFVGLLGLLELLEEDVGG